MRRVAACAQGEARSPWRAGAEGRVAMRPPGCSKTVLVRAVAAESGVNFVAVRGPEVSIVALCQFYRRSKVDASAVRSASH